MSSRPQDPTLRLSGQTRLNNPSSVRVVHQCDGGVVAACHHASQAMREDQLGERWCGDTWSDWCGELRCLVRKLGIAGSVSFWYRRFLR